MKNFVKQLGIISMALVIGFSFAACDDGSTGGGGGGSETLTYKGKGATSGDVYTLTIRKTAARAFTPVKGDEFELTAGTDKSKGTVDSITGSNFTLKPSNEGAPTFGAAVSGNDLTGLSGTITLTNGREVTVTETLTTVTTPGTNPGANITWTEANLPAGIGGGTQIHAIAYGGGKFVIGGNGGRMAYSTDGITWEAVAEDKDFAITAIAYGNDKFVAGGTSGKMAYSPDGITWTPVTDSKFVGTSKIIAIAYGGGKFVAGGEYGKMAYSSDGITWTAVPGGTYISSNNTYTPGQSTFGNNGISRIAYGNGKFVAMNGFSLAVSTDGVSWTGISWRDISDTCEMSHIVFGGGKFVAGGNYGETAYSTDGTTWTTGTFNSLDTYITGIGWGNGTFVASLGHLVMYSTDGVNWTAVAKTPNPGFHINAYGNNRFVAGNGFHMYYSTGL